MQMVAACGYNKGIVHSCFNKANISYTGSTNTSNDVALSGIVGWSEDYSMVKACYNVGNLSIKNAWTRYRAKLGGLVGGFSSRQILLTKCGYNVGSLSESGNELGGCIVGRNDRLEGK